jgi:glutamate formiminotransferase
VRVDKEEDRVLECVVNVSEGRRIDVLDAIGAAAGADLLDVHRDPHHHRAVLTLVGVDAPRAVAAEAVRLLDLRAHDGVHPRIGVVDVVPFVPLAGSTMADACAARDAFAAWVAASLGVPCFLYGPLVGAAGGDGPTLPDLRREAWRSRGPDPGPAAPHPTAGAMCIGARKPLVAYNVWLAQPDLDLARRVAAAIRGPGLRALGLMVGSRAQVSMNLIEPETICPAVAFDLVAGLAAIDPTDGAELVGLVPEAVLDQVDERRWAELDLSAERTIEARLALRAERLRR